MALCESIVAIMDVRIQLEMEEFVFVMGQRKGFAVIKDVAIFL